MDIAFAGDWPLDFFTSDPKAVLETARKVPVPENSDVFMIDTVHRWRVDEDGRLSRGSRMLYRVITEAGVKDMSEYSEPWTAWRQNRPQWRIRVITPDGQAHLLDPSVITEAGIPTQSAGLFTDTKMLAAPLPAVTKDSLIEIERTIEDREVVDPESVAEMFGVFKSTVHLKVVIDAPVRLTIHLATPGIPNPQRTESEAGGRRVISVEASNILLPPPLKFAPTDRVTTPYIAFSTAADWKHVAQWYSRMIEPQIGEKQPPVPAVDPHSRLKEMEAILAEIQKTVRYTGIEFGLSAYIPRSPQETVSRGYGDCKDKAALLIDRLRKAGIAANLALLTPLPQPDVLKDVPGVEIFSHAIVYVPGTHPLWIDPTSEFTPARRLPYPDQDRAALIIDPASTELTRTPQAVAEENTATETYHLQIAEGGKTSMTVRHQGDGVNDDTVRAVGALWQDLPEAKRAQGAKNFEALLNVEKTVSLVWDGPRDLTKPMVMTIRAEGFRNAGGSEQAVYAFVPQQINQPGSFTQILAEAARAEAAGEKRTEDYDLLNGYITEERWRVTPPRGFKVKTLPKLSDVTFGPVTLSRKVSLEPDDSVLLVYRLAVLKSRFTVAEVRQIAEDAKRQSLQTALRLDFMPEGALLMADGKWKEGMVLLRRDASADPPSSGALLRYSSALLDAGFRDEALRICRKAIEADPASARAYAYLSYLYRHDAVGRANKPGIDLAEADKAIQKAAALEPGNKRWVAERAFIKELSPTGPRWEKPEQLAEAIGLLEGISADLKSIEQQNALPEVLLLARRFADLKAFYEKEEGGKARLDYRFAALAMVDGAASAIRESRVIQPDDTLRKAALQTAARALIGLGEYGAAAELLPEATSAVSESTLHLLRNARRQENAKLSKDPAIAVVQQYIFALCDPDVTPKYDELLSPEWRTLTLNSERTQMLTLVGAYRNVAGVALGTRDLAAIVIGNVEFVKEGGDASGYRVRFADPASNGALKTIAWVVRRGDAYRVLGLRSDEAPVGGEALALAQKGDLDSARVWLNWEREEIAAPSGSDPLVVQPFLKLWASPSDAADKNQVLAAAAALVARGRYAATGVEQLQALRDQQKTDVLRRAIEQATVTGLGIDGKFGEAIPYAEDLWHAYPASAAALNSLGNLQNSSGRMDEALTLTASIKPANDAVAVSAARVASRAHAIRHEYAEAIGLYRTLCDANKCAAVDWNNLAWLTLFAPGAAAADRAAAETAVRMTQDRTVAYIHTLASIQAETGQLKEARAGLVRYMGAADRVDDSAWYLEGRIAEGLGIPEIATAIYSKIAKPERLTGESAYELAQIRLALLK